MHLKAVSALSAVVLSALLCCSAAADLPLDNPASVTSVTASDVFLSAYDHDGSDFVYPEEYAGHWTDGDRFHIALTDVSEETLAAYVMQMQSFAAKTIFHHAQYSYAELKEGAAYYIHELGNHVGNIVGYRIIPMLNCIVLEHIGDREAIEEALETVGAPEDMFTIGQSTTVCPMPEIIPPAVVSGGSQIYAIEAVQLLEQAFDYAYGGYPDHYAGCWLDGGVLHVGVTADDADTLSVYRDILAPAACEIVYDVQPYGYNQLMALHNAITEQLSGNDTYALSSWGVDTSECLIAVESRIGYTDELYNALVSLAAELGMGEDAFHLAEYAVEIVAETGDGTVTEEHIIETPAVEEVAEEVSAQSRNLAVELPVGLSMNPLRPYFSEIYGENIYPNHYAGCWHESTAVLPASPDENEYGEVSMEMSGELVLHIMLTEEVDKETLEKYRELCMAEAAFISDIDFSVVFDRAEYSYNTLRYIKEEAKARYEARVGSEKYLKVTMDEPNNRVVLRCEEYDDALRAVIDELTEEFGQSGALFEVKTIETEVVIAEPQTGTITEWIAVPQFEVIEEPIEEVVVEEILTMSVSVSENPLLPYFEETYSDLPDWYAGCWRDGNGNLHVALTENAGEDTLEECRAVCGNDVILETHKYSHRQLEVYKTEALARGRDMGLLISGGIDEYANQAELHVTPPYGKDIPAELTDMLDGLADEMGLGRDVYVLAVVLEPDEPAVEIVVEEYPEIIPYPTAQPQTSPATADSAALLCLLFSALSAAGIVIRKRGR